MRLRLLLGTLFALLVVSIAASLGFGPATASAIYNYDAPAIARVCVHEMGHVEGSHCQLSVVRDASDPPSGEVRGASTTSSRSFVATEAELPGTVRHYTTSEFAESISKGGEITPGPVSGKTWLTPDEYLDGVTAQSKLALNKTPDGYFEIPMCRVQCPSSPSVVQPLNGQPGGGIEITTNSPIDVTGIPFIQFGAR